MIAALSSGMLHRSGSLDGGGSLYQSAGTPGTPAPCA